MALAIDLISFLTILAAIAIFFGGLGFWFGKIMHPRNGEAAKIYAAINTLRHDVGGWRVDDRHTMRNETHTYVSPTLDKIDDVENAMTQLRERVVTLEADNRRRKPS